MQLSIRVLGLVVGLAVTGALAAKSVMGTLESLSQRDGARAAGQIARVLDSAYEALVPLSLERSVTQVGLSIATPLPADFRRLLDDQRRRSDDALRDLRARLGAADRVPGAPALRAEIDRIAADVAGIRRRADDALARPAAERPAGAAELPAGLIQAIDASERAVRAIKDPAILDAGRLLGLDSATNRAWRIREFGGRARTVLAIATLHGAPIPDDRLAYAHHLSGGVDQAWLALTASSDRGLSPASRAAVDGLRTAYFERYGELTSAVLARARTGGYGVDFPTFFARSNEAMAAAEALTAALRQDMIRTAGAVEVEATRALAAQLAVDLALALLGVGLMWFLMVRVSGRLGRLDAMMRRLAAGDLAIDPRGVSGGDEIGAMARTLAVFRDNAGRLARLGEEERAREARSAAERRAALLGLADGFERAVGGVVAGVSAAAAQL
ncbi:MAG TPA: HAMP domain-containing protein [Salinarimonas sp.]|nr:HAMP domain-containing protein [Salinarimonas sp.]